MFGHAAGLHADDRAAGRLGEGGRQARGDHLTPGHLDWAGIAVIKKAYGIFGRGAIARAPSPQPIATTCIGRN